MQFAAMVVCYKLIAASLTPFGQSEATDPHASGLFPQLQSLQGVTVNPGEKGNAFLGKLGSSFRRWCRQVKRIEIPPFTFNLHLLSRGENDKKGYPELDSNVKAAHTEPLLFYLCDVAKEITNTCQCNSNLLLQFCLSSFDDVAKPTLSTYVAYLFFKWVLPSENCLPMR